MTLASSPGWNRIDPACTQSRAPFTVCPNPGSTGSASRKIAVKPAMYL
jgi:hypothetical protein